MLSGKVGEERLCSSVFGGGIAEGSELVARLFRHHSKVVLPLELYNANDASGSAAAAHLSWLYVGGVLGSQHRVHFKSVTGYGC